MKLPRFTHALSLALGISVTAPVLAIWKNYDDAVNILGQPGLASPTRLFEPQDIAINPASGKVYVADAGNNRVLRFSSTAALSNGGAAEAVFGQPNLYTADRGLAQDKLEYPGGVAIDAAGRLWVADIENNRVLRWDNADTAPAARWPRRCWASRTSPPVSPW